MQQRYSKHGFRVAQAALVLSLVLLLCGLFIAPVNAAPQLSVRMIHDRSAAPLNATIYLPTGSLQSLFQQRLNAELPTLVSSSVGGLVHKMPSADQGWVQQMASALIQPTATVTQLLPQKDGLATTVLLRLFSGDPHPTTVTMLVTFSMQNSSTIQVSAHSTNGSPELVDGPLTTFKLPLGQLQAVSPTPTCGNSALALSLQFPASSAQALLVPSPADQIASSATISGQALLVTPTSGLSATTATMLSPSTALSNQQLAVHTEGSNSLPSYIEVPISSLTSLGSSFTSFSVGNGLQAQNFHVSVQNNNLVVTSDIVLGSTSIKVATATTYIQPSAVKGKLVMHVQKTTLTVLVFTFPDDVYNAQIEQVLDKQLGSVLAGKFNVTDATIGSNKNVPCVAKDSLLLTGSANLT